MNVNSGALSFVTWELKEGLRGTLEIELVELDSLGPLGCSVFKALLGDFHPEMPAASQKAEICFELKRLDLVPGGGLETQESISLHDLFTPTQAEAGFVNQTWTSVKFDRKCLETEKASCAEKLGSNACVMAGTGQEKRDEHLGISSVSPLFESTGQCGQGSEG